MTDLFPTSPTPPLLPPLPARGAGAPLPSAEDFKALLASQGLKSSGAVPSEDEAKITAAQIAAKAEVNARIKRDPRVAGMNANAPTPIPAPNQGRFMPLREGPSAARTFSGSPTSVESLRATRKFAPGPTRPIDLTASNPAVARTLHSVVPATTETSVPTVAAPTAIEAYNFGLRNADSAKPRATQDVPAWFGDAVQAGLEKYDAMKSASR